MTKTRLLMLFLLSSILLSGCILPPLPNNDENGGGYNPPPGRYQWCRNHSRACWNRNPNLWCNIHPYANRCNGTPFPRGHFTNQYLTTPKQ